MNPRPPQPEDKPTRGEGKPFHTVNPWSGPYFVFVVLGVAGGAVLVIVASVLAGF